MGIGQGGHKKVAEGAAKGEGGGGGKACPVADQQSKALYVKTGDVKWGQSGSEGVRV